MANENIPPPSPSSETSFWQVVRDKTLAIFKWLAKVLVAPGIAVVIVVGALLLIAFGIKNLQIGGLLGKLFGKKSPEKKALEAANTVPKGRVDANGKIIPQGTPDSKGMIQAVVVPIENPGLFSNPGTVKFTPPGQEKPIEIQLPDGIKAKDVEKIIIMQPEKFVVTVKDSSGIKADTIENLLKKYG